MIGTSLLYLIGYNKVNREWSLIKRTKYLSLKEEQIGEEPQTSLGINSNGLELRLFVKNNETL